MSSLTIGDNAFPQILLVELGNWEVRGQNLTVTCRVAKKKKDQVLQVFFLCPLSLGSCLIEQWVHVFCSIPFAAGVNKEALLMYFCIVF